MPIQANDYVLCVFDPKRRWLLQVVPGDEFHTHKGIIRFDDLVGHEYGEIFETTPSRKQFFVFQPLPSDFVVKMDRKTQIIYPEDIGLILVYTGVGPGSRVVEAGTGSGALTANLAYYTRPTGHVYTYDVRPKSLRQARRNLTRMGVMEWISIEKRDVTGGIPVEGVDAVILDLPSPWLVVEHAWQALAPGGAICLFSPTIEQVKKNVHALHVSRGYALVQTMEIFRRDYQVKENATRPKSRMIGHTGFLTFARKVEKNDMFERRQALERAKKAKVTEEAKIPTQFFERVP